MSFSINIAIITGNVTREPELRYTPSGSAVCTFGVATNYSVKKGDQWTDVPCFHNVVVWGKQAEFLTNTLKKGMKVSLQGRIDNRSYDGKDGTKKYISEIVAETVVPFTERRSAGDNSGYNPASSEQQSAPPQSNEKVEDIVIPDDMPF